MDVFRVRLNYIDTYQALPTKFDSPLRNSGNVSQLYKEPRIPIIRVFGSTETGQKVCAHIHGAYPYLYIEYTGSLTSGEVSAYINRVHLSIDYALSISYKRDLRDGDAKFVAQITLVKGIPFYGFHVGYRYFLKIYMLDPSVMNRLADLLRQGVVIKQIFQPYEAHLQYLLQWMVDYNLYGCDYIDCSKVMFRLPVPDYVEFGSHPHIWHSGSIPDAQVSEPSELPKISHCSIEVDICVQDILNRNDVKARALHHDFIEHLTLPTPGEKLVRSMASLWNHEARRRKSTISGLESDTSQSCDIPVSMSSGQETLNPNGWIHEDEYRAKMLALIKDEKDNSGEANISFSSFVKHSTLDSNIKTSLESVEDLFPENLHLNPGRSLEASALGTQHDEFYSDLFVDEQRITTIDPNDTDQTKSDSDDGDDVSEQVLQSKRETESEEGPAILIDAASEESRIESGPSTDVNNPDRYTRNLLEPIDSVGIITTGRVAVPTLPPDYEASRPYKTDGIINTHKDLVPATYSGPFLQPGFRSQPPTLPIVNDSYTRHAARKLSQKSFSPPSVSQKRRDNLLSTVAGSSNLSSPIRRPVVDKLSEAESLPDGILHSPLNMKSASSSEALGGRLLAFHEPPPSPVRIMMTMQKVGLPSVIYQDAYYSDESDVVDHSREWAGKEFKLASSTTPFLPMFDPSGRSEAKYYDEPSVIVDKLKGGRLHQYLQHCCSLQSWEIATPPPSYAEVHGWYCSEQMSTQTKRVKHGAAVVGFEFREENRLSQIDGLTQKNKHGFKYTQNKPLPSEAQQEAQYMSIMSLEIHVNTRADFVPDPQQDEIQSIFWCFQPDEARLENVEPEDTHLGHIAISDDNCAGRKFPSHRRIELHEELSELDLMLRLVETVRCYDPDILTGFEVHSSSWGYLIERARMGYDYNIDDELSRIKTQSRRRSGKDNDEWGFKHTSAIRITGRHVINIWRAMRNELNLLHYTMENVVFHLLHRRVPHFSWRDLTKWYTSGNPHDAAKVVTYYLSRVQFDLEILEKNELIPRTSEQARILGVDFFSVFSRGSQFKVESLMFRIAKSENFLLVSPSRKQIGGQNALECLPLVMEPQSAFYTSPVLVLDFQSLYPSVMIAYNYCYSTCLGRVVNWRGTNKIGFTEFKRQQRLIELLKDHINIAPNGIMFTKPSIRKSLLAKMLSEILETRVMVKNAMKSNKADKSLQRLLNNRQLALKLIANVTYGYTSASFSGRMPCSEIADSIVQTGRETLEKAIALIHSVERWGAEVVYGDTDSLFVHLKGRSKGQAFTIGKEIAEAITNINPSPIKLKFEKVYLPCLLLAKKRYVGFKYDNCDQVEPTFDAKGIETVRRDGTPAEQMIEERALKILFRTSDLSQVKTFFQKQCEKIMKGSVSVQDFCFAREVKLGTYSGKGPPPPGALISTRRMLVDARAEPQYGERIRYVVATGAPGARLVDRCMPPEELLDDEHIELDSEYYISKNLIPPLERIFNLVGANVRSWYDEMPKFQRIRRVGNSFQPQGQSREPGINKKTLESYMKASSCLLCGEKLDRDGPLCVACLENRAISLLSLRARLRNAEKNLSNLQNVCQSCSAISPLDEVKCDSKDCPVFYTRAKQTTRLKTERAVIEPVIEHLAERSNEMRDLEW